jgi:antitoxin component of MazEF toxin-antitoxin module
MSEVATVTLKKWGNSLGLLLPASVAKAAHLASGMKVEIDLAEHGLVVRKAPGQSRLEALCQEITPERLHAETDWGNPQGNEVW